MPGAIHSKQTLAITGASPPSSLGCSKLPGATALGADQRQMHTPWSKKETQDTKAQYQKYSLKAAKGLTALENRGLAAPTNTAISFAITFSQRFSSKPGSVTRLHLPCHRGEGLEHLGIIRKPPLPLWGSNEPPIESVPDTCRPHLHTSLEKSGSPQPTNCPDLNGIKQPLKARVNWRCIALRLLE